MLQLIPRVDGGLVTLEIRQADPVQGDDREAPAERFYRTLFNWVRQSGQKYLVLDFIDHRPDTELLETVEMAAKRLDIPVGLVGLHYKDEIEAQRLAHRTPRLLVAPSSKGLMSSLRDSLSDSAPIQDLAAEGLVREPLLV